MLIQIDFDVSADALARVQQLLNDTSERDVDFNGVSFEIVRGDGTEIADNDESDPYDVARLFTAIQGAIAGPIETPDGYRRDSTGKVFHE